MTLKKALIDSEPMICVPIAADSFEAFETAFNEAMTYQPDVVEWRADYILHTHMNPQQHQALRRSVFEVFSRAYDGVNPFVIVTLRDPQEGGKNHIDDALKIEWIQEALVEPWLDAVDLEMQADEQVLNAVIELCQIHEKKLILSHHDFEKMPELEMIVSRVAQAFLMGADIVKVAYMAVHPWDLQILKRAMEILYERNIGPMIAVAMGALGVETRLNPEKYHSVLTYAAVGEKTAPGQVHMDQIKANQ